MYEHNFIEDQLIILTKHTLDIFLKAPNPAELVALYTFYYYTAKWQKTNTPKCTTGYVAQGLNWGEAKVRKVKKQLLEYGLISDEQSRDEEGKVTGHYIKMNYIFKTETIQEAIHPIKKPQGGESHKVESKDTNALSSNKLNALSSIIEKERVALPPSVVTLIDDYCKGNEEIAELLIKWLKNRKTARAVINDNVVKGNLKKLDNLASESKMSVAEYLSEIICRGWRAFYPITTYASKGNTSGEVVTINGKEYEKRNGKFYIPNGNGVPVDPYADTSLF